MNDFAPDDGNYTSTIPLVGTLDDLFYKAATTDGLIQGIEPLEFLKSLATKNEAELASLGIDATWMAAAYGGGEAAGGWLSAMVVGPLAVIFEAVMLIDGGRSMTVFIVNATGTSLTLEPSKVHMPTGEAVSSFGSGDAKGIVSASGRDVLPEADSVPGMDGPVMGFLMTQKKTTLGVGFYGTDVSIWLKPTDTDILPEGVYISWSVPEDGDNTCAVSVNRYRDAEEFYDKWVNSDKVSTQRQKDDSTYSGTMPADPITGDAPPAPVVHCAMSSQSANNPSMVVYIGKKG